MTTRASLSSPWKRPFARGLALLALVGCDSSNPTTPASSLQPLQWADLPALPSRLEVGESFTSTVRLSEGVAAHFTVTASSDALKAVWRVLGPGYFEFTITGEKVGRAHLTITAKASGYQTAEITFEALSVSIAPEPPPPPLYISPESEPEPRVCTDERERAMAYGHAWGLPHEWDGTPFRVNLFDHFPAVAGETYPEDQLEMLAELAAVIEEQIGYPIIEAGSVIPVPEELPDDWHRRSFPDCAQWREPGTAMGVHLDALPDGHRGGGALSAHYACATIFYWVGDGVPPPGWSDLRAFKDAVVHELFHLFGYKHSSAHYEPHQGIVMSLELLGHAFRGRQHAVTFEDIDALRCIFPK